MLDQNCKVCGINSAEAQLSSVGHEWGTVRFSYSYADRDGKPIEAAGLTTNQKVRVHYKKVGGDNIADKISLIP